MKVFIFISQPMNGRTDEEILNEREAIVDELTKQYGDDISIINSFIGSAPEDAAPLWYLGKSLELLSTADVAVFAKGWKNARGCRIEHEACEEYGIKIMEL